MMIGTPAGKVRFLDALHQGQDCAGEIYRRGGAAGLIVDHTKLLALGAKPEHGLDEIRSERAIDPGGAQNEVPNMGDSYGALPRLFACGIDSVRTDRVVFPIRDAGRRTSRSRDE